MGELSVRELPLFPLPEVVLFPQEVLPLHIFESRYRMMLQSVLESDSMFGVIKWDPTTKSMANIGCCAQIIKHQTAEDGRSNIITLGQQRFQVLEITRSPPFCTAMVSWISDHNIDDLQKLDSLKDSVKEALSDVINLTSKLTNTKKNLPDKLPDNPVSIVGLVAITAILLRRMSINDPASSSVATKLPPAVAVPTVKSLLRTSLGTRIPLAGFSYFLEAASDTSLSKAASS